MERIMLLGLLLMSSALSIPSDDFLKYGEIDIMRNMERNFFPDKSYSEVIESTGIKKMDVQGIDVDNKYLKRLNELIEKGVAAKGLTFNIYHDPMREAVITLFRLFQSIDGDVFTKVSDWAKNNMNKEMYMYALRLETLYSQKTNESSLVPPFIWNPHYFVNSETLAKASLIVDDIRTYGRIDGQSAAVNQYDYPSFTSLENFVVINTNYSGWNLQSNMDENELNYFREDVSLNSYYFGVHLLYPFWMSNEELEMHSMRFAEHYYYTHQQLLARYNLEKLHLKTKTVFQGLYEWDYIPYLSYKNGLSFPTRSCIRGYWENDTALLKSVDSGIRESISNAQFILTNETLDTKNYRGINNLAKTLRAHTDEVKVAKTIRSVVGYGGNKYVDEYDPAPSLLHHPETSLRDPAYWYIIQRMINYFTDSKKTKEFDLSNYETEEFQIVNYRFSRITTFFEDFKFSVNYATGNYFRDVTDWRAYVTVKQRRLSHGVFSLNFFVESLVSRDTVVRLHLGPECNDCWKQYDKFFELDTFRYTLEEGLNIISWGPESSNKLSFDYDYDSVLPNAGSTKYSIFRFPEKMLIPRGLEEGLNLTLFIIITPTDFESSEIPLPRNLYREVTIEYDSKPLGFPFHSPASGFNETAFNYKFYNLSIYHIRQQVNNKDYFSPNLY